MKTLLIGEYVGGLVLGAYLFSLTGYPWWAYAVLFFTPDMGMAGYVFGPRAGAATYNLFHHLGVSVAIYLAGAQLGLPALQAVGAVILSHLFFDRAFGYGLKYADAFKRTHLGTLK